MVQVSVSNGSSLVPYSFHILVKEILIILQTTANHRIDFKNDQLESENNKSIVWGGVVDSINQLLILR